MFTNTNVNGMTKTVKDIYPPQENRMVVVLEQIIESTLKIVGKALADGATAIASSAVKDMKK